MPKAHLISFYPLQGKENKQNNLLNKESGTDNVASKTNFRIWVTEVKQPNWLVIWLTEVKQPYWLVKLLWPKTQ